MMTLERLDNLVNELKRTFKEEREIFVHCSYDEVTLEILNSRLLVIMKILRDKKEFQFEQVIDICGVDFSTYGKSEWSTNNSNYNRAVDQHISKQESLLESRRFAVIYHLISYTLNHRLRVKILLNSDNLVTDSVINLWKGADWFEREVFDMYGILFQGHPDLRRILTDYGFIGHPLRKDFPLIGEIERRYDPEQKRVVYEPVQIHNRILVPRVIRTNNKYKSNQKKKLPVEQFRSRQKKDKNNV